MKERIDESSRSEIRETQRRGTKRKGNKVIEDKRGQDEGREEVRKEDQGQTDGKKKQRTEKEKEDVIEAARHVQTKRHKVENRKLLIFGACWYVPAYLSCTAVEVR